MMGTKRKDGKLRSTLRRVGREAIARGSRWATIAIVVLGIGFWTRPAYAMHISEGILPIDWASVWFLVAALSCMPGCGRSSDGGGKIRAP